MQNIQTAITRMYRMSRQSLETSNLQRYAIIVLFIPQIFPFVCWLVTHSCLCNNVTFSRPILYKPAGLAQSLQGMDVAALSCDRDFDLHTRVKTGSGAQAASYLVGNRGDFPSSKNGRCVKLTGHLLLVPRSVTHRPTPLLPQYVLLERRLHN
jgi:hypothetical protein